MSSWQYAYLFPGREMSLQPHRAIQVLKDFGLVFDPSLRMCVAIDDKGHVLNCGDEIKLDVPIEASLEERLQHGEQFSVQSGNSDIYLTSIFASQSGNPHLVIAWSKRLFLLLEDDKKQEFYAMLRTLAHGTHSRFVLLGEDVVDQFEDCFLLVDSRRMLDTTTSTGYGTGLFELWVDTRAIDDIYTDPPLRRIGEPEGGFVRFVT